MDNLADARPHVAEFHAHNGTVEREGWTAAPPSAVVISIFLLVACVAETYVAGPSTIRFIAIGVAVLMLAGTAYVHFRMDHTEIPEGIMIAAGLVWMFCTSLTMALLAYSDAHSLPTYAVGGVGVLSVAAAPFWPNAWSFNTSLILTLLPVSYCALLRDGSSTNLAHLIPFLIIIAALATLRHRISSKYQDNLQTTFDELQYMTNHDWMTGLLSRQHWLAMAEKAVLSATSEHDAVSVMYIDIDEFKKINDTHGHEAGDRVLLTVSRLLQFHAPAHALIGRIGGDELAICLPGQCCADTRPLAEHLLGHTDIRIDGLPLITISIGIACTQEAATLTELLHRADIAMLRAKRLGRNRVQVYADTNGAIDA